MADIKKCPDIGPLINRSTSTHSIILLHFDHGLPTKFVSQLYDLFALFLQCFKMYFVFPSDIICGLRNIKIKHHKFSDSQSKVSAVVLARCA